MRIYRPFFRDPITYVDRTQYQSLREAVNALLKSEKVELPRAGDENYEFDENPGEVPEDFVDTRLDRMDAAASAQPKRQNAKKTEQIERRFEQPEVETKVETKVEAISSDSQ